MAHRGRGRGRGEGRPQLGRGGKGFGNLGLRDEGLRITVPNFGTKSTQPQSKPPEVRSSSREPKEPPSGPGVSGSSGSFQKSAVPGFKTNAFKPIGGPVSPPRSRSSRSPGPVNVTIPLPVKRPVGDRLGPPPDSRSPPAQRESLDDCEPISPGGFESPDESIRITVGNERYLRQDGSIRGRYDDRRKDRDSQGRKDSSRSRDAGRSGRGRDDGRGRSDNRGSKDYGRGYKDSRDGGRQQDSRGYRSDRDRDRQYEKDRRSDKSKYRESSGRRSSRSPDSRSRGHHSHSRETSEDRHSRSSRQDSHSRDTASFDNKKGKDEGLDLYDDLPASENLQYPAPQADIFKSDFITSNWERISMEERSREKEEEERHFQDVQERERHLRDEILRENSERQSRQQFQQSRFSPEERMRETRPEERPTGSYSFAEERARAQETLPGLGDIESQGQSYQQSPPPAQGGASILPGMAQTMDIEDEDEFLYGGDNDEPKTSQARVQPESQALMQGRLPDRPRRQTLPPERPQVTQRPAESSYTDRRSDQPTENLSASQTELKKRLLGNEDLVLKLLTQDNMLRERLESIGSGDPREEVLRQKQRELVALLTGISSSLGQPNPLQNPVMVSDPLQPSRHETLMQPSRDTMMQSSRDTMMQSSRDAMMQSSQYGAMMQQSQHETMMPMHLQDRIRTTLPHLVQPTIPEPKTTKAVQPPPEPEKPKTDSDPTIRSILKSIGFNFELSKLMQEKAQRERGKHEKTDSLDTFGIKQPSSSFLKEGLSNVDLGSVFDPKAAGATGTSQKKPSILLEQSMSYEERARKYREEQMKAYAQGKASPPPFEDSEKQKPQEASPDAYDPSSTAPYYQDNTYDPGYSQPQTVGYEERAYLESNKMTDYGYYGGVVPQEYGEEPTTVTSSNLTVIQPVETEQPSMRWQDPNLVPVSSQQQQQSSWGYQEFGSQQGNMGWRGGPDPSSVSSSVPFDTAPGGYDPHRDYNRDDRKRQEDRDSMRSHSKHDYDDFTDRYDKRSHRPSSGSSSKPPIKDYKEKASNRTVLPPRHEQRRDMSPPRKEYGRDVSPKEERRRVYSPRREKPRARTDRERSGSPERRVKKPLSPQFRRERDLSPKQDNRQYGPKLPSPMLKPETTAPSTSRNRDRDQSPSPARQKPDSTSSSARDPNVIVMTGASREKLAREMEERHKRLRALSRELERLRQQHNELLRKKKRQKDGHKDPLLLENSKLQDEIAKQISTLRKAAEDNAAKLAKAKSPEVRRIETDDLLIPFKRPPVEDIKTPRELMREKLSLQQADRVPKEEQEQEELKPSMNREPGATTVKKTITVEKKEVKKIIKKPEKHYEYFDPGNHWCDLCNKVAGGLNDILQHMHTSQHEGNVDPYNRPWLPESLKKPAAKLPKANVMVAPLTGVEFLLPTRAFYCSLCKDLVADVTCAEEHLKSHTHNQKYQLYLNDNPYYEKKRNLDKAARMTTSHTEAVKTQEKRKAEDFELLQSKRPKAEETGAKGLKDLKKHIFSPSHGKGTKHRSRSRSYSRSRSRSHDRSSSRRSRSRSRSYGRGSGRRSRSRSYSRSHRSRSRSRSSSRSRSPRHGSRGSRRKSRSPRRRSRSPHYRSRSRSRSRRRSRSPRYKRSRRSRSPRIGRRSRSRDRGSGYSKSKPPYSSGKSFDSRGDKFSSDPKNNSQDSDDKKRFSIKLAGKTTLRPTNILRGGIRGGRKGPKPLIMPPKEPSFLLRKKLGKDANAKDGKDKEGKESIGPEPAPLDVFLSIGNMETRAGKSLPVIQEKIQAAFQGKGEDPLKTDMEKQSAAEKQETKNVVRVDDNKQIPIAMVPLPPMPAAPPKVPVVSVKDSVAATIPTVAPEPKASPAPSVPLPASENQQISIAMVPLPPSAPKTVVSSAAGPSVALPAVPEKKATSTVDPTMDIQDEDRKLLGIDMPSAVASIPRPPPPPPPTDTGSTSTKPLPSQTHKDASSLYSIFYSSSTSQSTKQDPIQSVPTTTATTAVSLSTVQHIPMPTPQVQAVEQPLTTVDNKPTEAPVGETVAMEADSQPSKPGIEGVSTSVERAITTTQPCQAKTVETVTEGSAIAAATPATAGASVTMATEATEEASTGIAVTKAADATEGPVPEGSISGATGSIAGEALVQVPVATEATEEAITEEMVTKTVTPSQGAAMEGFVTVTESQVTMATEGAATKGPVTMAMEATEEAVTQSPITMATEATEGAVAESQATIATRATGVAVAENPVTITAEATEVAGTESPVTIATEATEGAVAESPVTMAKEVTESPVSISTEATVEAVAENQVTIATEATEVAVTESSVTMAKEVTETQVTMGTEATGRAVIESPVTIATEATEVAVTESSVTMAKEVTETQATMATEATGRAVTESQATMATEATEGAVTESQVMVATEEAATESLVTMATEATERAMIESPVTIATEATEGAVTESQVTVATEGSVTGSPVTMVTEATEDTEAAVTTAPITLAAEAALAEEAVTMTIEATVDVRRTAIEATNNGVTDSGVSGCLEAEVANTVAETTSAQPIDTTEEAMDVAPVEEGSQAVESSASAVPPELAVRHEEPAVVHEEEALNQDIPTEEPMECVEQSTKPAEEVEQEAKPVNGSTSGAGSVEEGGMPSLQSAAGLGAGLKTPAGLTGTEDQMMTDLMDPMDDSVVSELMQSLQDPEIRDMPTMMEPTVSDLLAGIGGGSTGRGEGGEEEGGRGGGVQDSPGDLCSEAVMEIAKLAHSAASTAPAEASTEEESTAATEEEETKTELDTSAAAAPDEGTEDKEGTDVDLSVSTEDADSQESGSPKRKPPARKKPGRKRRGGKRW